MKDQESKRLPLPSLFGPDRSRIGFQRVNAGRLTQWAPERISDLGMHLISTHEDPPSRGLGAPPVLAGGAHFVGYHKPG